MFYFGGQFDNLNIMQLNPPNGGSVQVINPTTNPVATIENPVPASLYPTIGPVGLPGDWNTVTVSANAAPNRFHPDTNVQNWNLQVSRQFHSNVLEVGYVGSKGTHVDSSMRNWNEAPPGPGDIQSRRPYPEYANIRREYFYGNTNYNSLQARFEHRFSAGLSYTAAYTWSHLFDDEYNTMNSGGCACQNARDLRPEYASSAFDQRHRLVMGYVWEVPFGKSLSGATALLARGWSLNGIITLTSGSPFDVNESFDSQNDDGLTEGQERPDLVPGVPMTVSNKNVSMWFNTAAFTAIIDTGVVVGKLLIAMRNAKLVQPPHEPTGTVEQVELIPLAAVDIKCLQPAEIARLGFDRNYRVLPQPIRPAFLDNLAGVERDRQPDAKELRRIGIVAGRHRQRVDHLAGTIGMLLGFFELPPPALDGVPGAGERAQDCWHIGQIAQLEAHIAGVTGRGRPDVGVAQRVCDRAIPARALAEHAAAPGTAAFEALLDRRQHFMQQEILPGAHRS